jgi:hypothetical protein
MRGPACARREHGIVTRHTAAISLGGDQTASPRRDDGSAGPCADSAGQMTHTIAGAHEPTEHDKVVSWRLHVLIEAGYTPASAERLAERTDVDLHRAVAIVRRGCSPRLAARILL